MVSKIEPIYGTQRTRLATAVPLSTPYSIYVFPSTYCNFKCVYCAHMFSPEVIKEKYGLDRQHMPMETFHKVVAQMAEFPQRFRLLSLTGQGEPLMNKHIPDMVSIAKAADVAERIEIISNGRLLTRKMADRLIEAGLDTLRISLQGLTTQKYKDIGGVNVEFEEIYENIRYFHQQSEKPNYSSRSWMSLSIRERKPCSTTSSGIARTACTSSACSPRTRGWKSTQGMKDETTIVMVGPSNTAWPAR